LELLAELPPQRSAERLLGLASELSRLADAIDVPDAPLGLPAPSSALASAIIRSRLSPPPEVVAHLRLLDVSGLGALNIAKGLELAGVSRLLLLRGDAPAVGDPCNNEPESVMNTLRSSGVKLRLGLLLSLAKSLEEVDEEGQGQGRLLLRHKALVVPGPRRRPQGGRRPGLKGLRVPGG